MKSRIFNLIGKSALPMLVAGAVLTLGSPAAALAEGHGGHSGGGDRGGHSYSSGRSYSGGRDYDRGRSYGGYRGGYYRGGGYYGGGLALGFGAPYYGGAYGYAPAPAPCGYYDRWGYWHADPYCYNGGVRY